MQRRSRETVPTNSYGGATPPPEWDRVELELETVKDNVGWTPVSH